MVTRKKITILLADDHGIVRQGIRALLETELDFSVLGEAAGGEEAIELARTLKPDVIVTDLKMRDASGIDVCQRVRSLIPNAKCIVLSMYDNDAWVAEALEAGAQAYVLKDSSAGDLIEAIRAVMDGQRFLSPPLTEERIEEYRKRT